MKEEKEKEEEEDVLDVKEEKEAVDERQEEEGVEEEHDVKQEEKGVKEEQEEKGARRPRAWCSVKLAEHWGGKHEPKEETNRVAAELAAWFSQHIEGRRAGHSGERWLQAAASAVEAQAAQEPRGRGRPARGEGGAGGRGAGGRGAGARLVTPQPTSSRRGAASTSTSTRAVLGHVGCAGGEEQSECQDGGGRGC